MPGRRHSALLAKLATNRADTSQRAIVDELRRVILDGGAPHGCPIPVNEVAEVFGVSPIPVRESLKTLTAEGVVQAETYLEVGETIRPVRRDGDRRGYVIAVADSSEEAVRRADAAAKLLKVEIAT